MSHSRSSLCQRSIMQHKAIKLGALCFMGWYLIASLTRRLLSRDFMEGREWEWVWSYERQRAVLLGFCLFPSSCSYFSDFLFGLLFFRVQSYSLSCFVVCPLVREVDTGACCRLPDGRVWYLSTGKWTWVLSLLWVGLCLWVCVEAAMCLGGF